MMLTQRCELRTCGAGTVRRAMRGPSVVKTVSGQMTGTPGGMMARTVASTRTSNLMGATALAVCLRATNRARCSPSK